MNVRASRNDPSHETLSVGGDKNTIRDVKNVDVINQGRGTVTVTYGSDATELAEKFLDIYRLIDTRPEDPNVDKDEIATTVKHVENETSKQQPNTVKIERWLKRLGGLAPDLLPVVVSTLLDPSLGVATAVCTVAKKVLSQDLSES